MLGRALRDNLSDAALHRVLGLRVVALRTAVFLRAAKTAPILRANLAIARGWFVPTLFLHLCFPSQFKSPYVAILDSLQLARWLALLFVVVLVVFIAHNGGSFFLRALLL